MDKKPVLAWILVASLFSPIALSADGRVISLAGEAFADRNGRQIPLKPGDAVFSRDTINTRQNSIVRFRMSDDSYFALPADSSLRINDYYLPSQSTNAPARAFLSLIKGGFRTVTGLVGKLGRDTYQVRTPVSTLGVRGTEYSVFYCRPGECGSRTRTETASVFSERGAVTVALAGVRRIDLAQGPDAPEQGSLTIEVIAGTLSVSLSPEPGSDPASYEITEGRTLSVSTALNETGAAITTGAPSISDTRPAILSETTIRDLVFNPENPVDRPSSLETTLRQESKESRRDDPPPTEGPIGAAPPPVPPPPPDRIEPPSEAPPSGGGGPPSPPSPPPPPPPPPPPDEPDPVDPDPKVSPS